MWILPAPWRSKRRSCAQDRQEPDLLRQPRAGCLDHVASAAAWRLSRRAGCNVARSDRRGARGARWYVRGSSSSAARDLDRPAARRGKLDSLYTFQRVASGHCNAKRRQLSRCGATLESWTSHFPRGHRCGAHRSNKRDPMSSVQGSRSAHHLRSLPPMWWHIYKITKINRDPHALGVAQRTTTGLGQWPRPKSRGTRIGRPAPRSAALARVPEPRTVDPDPTTPTRQPRPDNPDQSI